MGTAAVMDAWGASKGEAIHTQTFLGNPLGCAMALASLTALEKLLPSLEKRIAHTHAELKRIGIGFQGRGLLLGLQIPNPLKISRELLKNGYIALPAGAHAEVLAFTPPLNISFEQITAALECVAKLCRQA
jgi:acetylornithine/succinyldiaminopimelate/putrescine aminotransferase